MIQNIYIAPNKKTEKEQLIEIVRKAYENYDIIRFIFDLKNERINIDSVKKFSDLFDNFKEDTKNKLVETCVIIEDKLSANIFQKGIDMVKLVKPVKII